MLLIALSMLCVSASSISLLMTTTARNSMHRLCWSFVSRYQLRWMLYTRFTRFLIKQVKCHYIFFLEKGYSLKNWWVVCGQFHKTLTLFKIKICNFPYPIQYLFNLQLVSSLFCSSIPKRDLDTKKTTPNIEVCPESLGAMLEY